MTPLVIIFVAVFVVGPLAFLLSLRLAPSKRRSIELVCLVVGSTGMSASLRYLSGGWGQDAFCTLAERLLHLGREWMHLGGVDRGDCFLGAAILPT